MKKYLFINTGKSPALRDAVTALLDRVIGTGDKIQKGWSNHVGREGYPVLCTPLPFTNTAGIFHRRSFEDRGMGMDQDAHVTCLDAATQFGELVEFLSKPDISIENVALENGTTARSGVISGDGEKLTVGCHSATFEQIERAYNAMKLARGNK